MSLALFLGLRWLVAVAVAVPIFISVSVSSTQWQLGSLAGWDAGVLTWLILTALAARRADWRQAQTPHVATPFTLVAVTIASVLGFLGAVALAGRIGQPRSLAQDLQVALAIAAVVVSWLLLRTECRLHVARLQRDRRRIGTNTRVFVSHSGGPEFPDGELRSAWQFMYYAFPVIGYDFASEPGPVTPELCRVAILQSVMTYAIVAILGSFALNVLGPILSGLRVIPGG